MIYLKAISKEAFDTAIRDAGWVSTEEDTEYQILYSHTHSVDVIGDIYIETDKTITIADDEGDIIVNETILADGYHANLLLHGEELPQSLKGMVIDPPITPHRRFS